jgi:hypothetical protein
MWHIGSFVENRTIAGVGDAMNGRGGNSGSKTCPIPFRKIETVAIVDDLIELI